MIYGYIYRFSWSLIEFWANVWPITPKIGHRSMLTLELNKPLFYPPVYFCRVRHPRKDSDDQVEFSPNVYENAKASIEKPKPAPNPRTDKAND